MKNTKRILLVCLFALLIAAMFAMTAAAETFTGDVVKEDPDNANDLVWTFDSETGVLTISGTSTDLVLKPAPSWNTMGADTIPWWDHIQKITKVVVTAPVTSIGGYTFNRMEACKTIVFPANSIQLKGSMTFANMWALDTIGPEGTEEGTIDLRNFTGMSSQAFEQSSKNKTLKVLLPTEGNSPINEKKVWDDTTVATFYVNAGTDAENVVKTIKTQAEAQPDVSPYLANVTIAYYGEGEATQPEDDKDDNKPEFDNPSQNIQETKTATAQYGTPVIDGEIDAVWDATDKIDFPWNRQNASEYSLAEEMSYQDESQKPWAKVLWDADKLYVLTYVPDGALVTDSAISSYNRDGVEIYVDELNEKKPTRGEASSFRQLQYVADGSFQETQGAETAYNCKVFEGYYIVEVAYTFEKATPKKDLVIGFDVSINCNNSGDNVRDYCLSWNDRTNIAYKAPMYLGNLQLLGGEGVNEGTNEGEDKPGETNVVAEGTVDEQYSKCTWVLTNDGVITFTANATGWNEIPYDNSTENRWYAYADQIKKVVVGQGLQKVGRGAFRNCVNLESVQFGSVTQLAESAFENCPKLTTIYYEGNEPVEGVYDLSRITNFEKPNIFKNCGVTTVNMNSALVNLPENRFVDCVYLTNVTFGEKIETVNENAFVGCYNLKVIFGTKGTGAEAYATAKGLTFAEVGTSVEIPDAVVTEPQESESTDPTPDTTPSQEESSTPPVDDTSADPGETSEEPGEATQTGDINIVMIVAFAVAALGAAVVLMRKRRFN